MTWSRRCSALHLPKLLRSAGAVDGRVSVHQIVVGSLAAYRAMRNPDAVLAYLDATSG